MKNIAKLTSYGCYLDCDFVTAKYPGDETHIVGNVAEYVYDLEQKISDLEAKLAESEEKLEAQTTLRKMMSDESNVNLLRYIETLAKNEKLKQQLAEKDKTIENLRIDLKDYQDLEEKISTKYDKVVEKLEKADQDKISFAVEQLEKVKELLLENLYDLYSKPSEIWDKYGDLYDVVVEGAVNGTIDNQIEQLKEGK